MKIDVINLDAEKAGEIDLDEAVFGLEPRADILHRVVRWQLAKRQAGTHATKTRGEVGFTKQKMFRQKGTGRARHGSRGANIFRKGGVTKGPQPRSHAHDLPKAIRRLGLRHALSAKRQGGDLIVVENAELAEGRTKALAEKLAKLGWTKALVIDGAEVNENFARAARNIEDLDVLPGQGANVYDILKRDVLVLTRAGVEALEARLK